MHENVDGLILNTSQVLVHGQVAFIFEVSVGLSVCFFCAEFFSAVFDPISIKLGQKNLYF